MIHLGEEERNIPSQLATRDLISLAISIYHTNV